MWQKTNPQLYEQVQTSLQSAFPSLEIEEDKGFVHVKGVFPVIAESKIIDNFTLDIELPLDYPKSVPKIWETGGRIPRIGDRHVNTLDYTLCLFLADERWKYYPEGSTIIDFLKGPVTYFLWNQINFEATGKWINGERGHNVLGVAEYYTEELQTRDPRKVLNFLRYLGKKTIKGHWECWCGSTKKLRNCHIKKLLDLRSKISPEVAENSFKKLQEMQRKM